MTAAAATMTKVAAKKGSGVDDEGCGDGESCGGADGEGGGRGGYEGCGGDDAEGCGGDDDGVAAATMTKALKRAHVALCDGDDDEGCGGDDDEG